MDSASTYPAEAAATLVRTELTGVVVRHDVANVAARNDALYRAVRNFGRGDIAATAILAVDIALRDLRAKLLGRSLVSQLGKLRAVPVYRGGSRVMTTGSCETS